MTIAAGVLMSEGILFCADSEYTSQTAKVYRKKLFCHRTDLCLVVFAVSGDEYASRYAVERCIEAIESIPAHDLDWSTIKSTISENTLDVYERLVLSRDKSLHEQYHFDLLCGIKMRNDRLSHLLASSCGVVSEFQLFECIGCGSDAGNHHIQTWYKQTIEPQEALLRCSEMLSEVRREVPGVGGSFDFVFLSNQNFMASLDTWPIGRMEGYLAEFDQLTQSLKSCFFRGAVTELDVASELERFKTEAFALWEKCHADPHCLSPIHDTSPWGLLLTAPSTLQSPAPSTDDEQPQQPSPE